MIKRYLIFYISQNLFKWLINQRIIHELRKSHGEYLSIYRSHLFLNHQLFNMKFMLFRHLFSSNFLFLKIKFNKKIKCFFVGIVSIYTHNRTFLIQWKFIMRKMAVPENLSLVPINFKDYSVLYSWLSLLVIQLKSLEI